MQITGGGNVVMEFLLMHPQAQEFKRLDWFKKIDQLERNWDPISQMIAEGLAADWNTCMCGQQDPAIPRGESNVPKDMILATLGLWFFSKITNKEWNLARKIGKEIQIRAAWVLANKEQAAVEPQVEVATCGNA